MQRLSRYETYSDDELRLRITQRLSGISGEIAMDEVLSDFRQGGSSALGLLRKIRRVVDSHPEDAIFWWFSSKASIELAAKLGFGPFSVTEESILHGFARALDLNSDLYEIYYDRALFMLDYTHPTLWTLEDAYENIILFLQKASADLSEGDRSSYWERLGRLIEHALPQRILLEYYRVQKEREEYLARLEEAVRCLNLLVSRFPKYLKHRSSFSEQIGDLGQAIRDAEAVCSLPAFQVIELRVFRLPMKLAKLYWKAGHVDRALAKMREAVCLFVSKTSPALPVTITRGLFAFMGGPTTTHNVASPIPQFEAVVSNPGSFGTAKTRNVEAFQDLANWLVSLQRFEEADRVSTAASVIYPDMRTRFREDLLEVQKIVGELRRNGVVGDAAERFGFLVSQEVFQVNSASELTVVRAPSFFFL